MDGVRGVIVDENEDEDELDDAHDDDRVANYIVYYECDDTDVAHYLSAEKYAFCYDAPDDSWYLVRELEE